MRILRIPAKALLCLLLAVIVGWMTLAVLYTDLSESSPRHVLAILTALASIGLLLFLRPRKFRLPAFLVLFAIVLAWYFTRTPSNDRDWATDVSKVAWADLNGNQITFHNIRSFDYRSETDFTPRWRDQTFDLNSLQTVDIMLCYWGSHKIAHGIVSFDFADGQYLDFSIETRKQVQESFSTVQGFFRQYELIYIVADETDLIRLRTNFRKEDVYLYHTRTTPEQAREILMSYVDSLNSLRDHPEWYNALTTNCITSIVPHAHAANASAHNSWKTLLSGYAARQAYDNGHLDDSMPFEQLEAKSRINDVAVGAPDDSTFGQVIRKGLPEPGAPR
jgi:hypothetical protein